MKTFIALSVLICFSFITKSQTIIMNEVSNGPNGNKEYVEFVVASNTVTYSCSNTTPPCIDIRGWIFDDNSGLHGGTSGTGVAAGAVRFSQNSIWSCVPLGTIILIYNDIDRNPAIPADDISMADGNCRIIAPINNTTLFESNLTTPGAVACSYPPTGWTAGGNWNTTLLANGGDCARIVNLAGCEVFSVCWGNANTNNLIYFLPSASQTVFYFNDTDPTNQTNWISGSASSTPGAQTPGAPNNVANAAYINQFNNGCMPITPISMNTPTSANAGCICNGSATVTATGSIGPYSYVWYDSNHDPIGQTGATAIGLCAGAYTVVATSHIGCTDSTSVAISSTLSNPTVTVNPQTICSGSSTILSATPSASGGTYSWTPGGQTTQTISVSPGSTTTYSVTYILAGCTGTNTGIVTVNNLPTVSISASSTSLCAGASVTLTATSSVPNYSWTGGATSQTVSVNSSPIVVTTTNTCGSTSATQSLTIIPLPTVTISPNPLSLCTGQSAIIQANTNTAVTYTWSTTANTSTISVNAPGNYTVDVSNSCGNATATAIVNNSGSVPIISASSNPTVLCSGQTATLSLSGSTGTYSWSNGVTTSTTTVTNAGVYTATVTSSCGTATTSISISSLPTPTISVSPSTVTVCNGQPEIITATSNQTNFNWSTGAFTNTITITVNTSGVHTVSVSNTCGVATATVTVLQNNLPVLNLTPSSLTICPNETATLTVTGGTAPYVWSNSSSTGSVVISSGGVVTVSNTPNSCGTAITSITIQVNPVNANISATPTSGVKPVTVNFTNNSIGGIGYLWDFGNGNSANTQTVSPQTYTVGGNYVVYLTVTDGTCTDIDSLIIKVLNETPDIVVPNVFTPNGDSVNDIFKITGYNIVEFDCTIFDRWGLQMYSWSDITKGWNGKTNSKDASDGNYFYLINAKDIDGIEIKKQGVFLLIR